MKKLGREFLQSRAFKIGVLGCLVVSMMVCTAFAADETSAINTAYWDTDNKGVDDDGLAVGQEFVSRFRYSKLDKEFDNGRPGITVYHGSKKSAIRIRIYDKAAERGLPKGQHWIRVELQLRDERAAAFCFDPAPIGVLFRGVLVNYVRYVDDPGTDSNRWRWPMKPYWEDLIEQVGRIRLYVKPGIEYNIGQLNNFVFEQASNAMAAAFQIYGVPFCVEKIQNRNVMENPKYKRLVEQYGKNKSEVRAALGPGGEVHRGIPRGQFQREAGEPGPGHGGTS